MTAGRARFPRKDTLIAGARAELAAGADLAGLRSSLVHAHGADAANNIISRMRRLGDLPGRSAKLELIALKPTPKVRDRLRRLAVARGLALAAGLDAMERLS